MFLNIENRGDWEAYQRACERDRPFSPDDDPHSVQVAIHAIYVRTSRDDRLEQAVRTTMRRNSGTKRHWLAVDGPANLGKTESLLRFSTELDSERRRHSRSSPTFALVPVIIVQADSGHQGAGLLRAIASFAGIPTNGNEDELRRRLTQVLPRLGTELIVVDDAHMLRRASTRATRLPDSLRANLRLPVTFIFAGAGLDSSALLRPGGGPGYESTEQLRRRHSFLALAPLVLPRDEQIYRTLLGEFLRSVHSLVPHVEMPFHRDPRCLRELMRLTGGHLGAFMGALKDATVEAVWETVPVTSELVLRYATDRIDP
jgi:hypothetical protein